jgi:hypothetical protein
LKPYPVIREFGAMLKALKPGEQGGWPGRSSVTRQGLIAFNFRRRSNGIVAAFSAEECVGLGVLMDRTVAN